MSMSDAASFGAAVAAIVALGISTWQSRIMVNQQRAAIRPFIRPDTSMTQPPSFPAPVGYDVRPRNVGFGPAFNVSACLFPPQPSEGESVDAKGIACFQHAGADTFQGTPDQASSIGPGISVVYDVMVLDEGMMVPGNRCLDRRSRFTLFAPPSQFREGQFVVPTRFSVLGRLTFTYQDVEGHKHAGIFDYVERHGWKQVAYLHNISQTLDELNANYTVKALHDGNSAMASIAKRGLQ